MQFRNAEAKNPLHSHDSKLNKATVTDLKVESQIVDKRGHDNHHHYVIWSNEFRVLDPAEEGQHQQKDGDGAHGKGEVHLKGGEGVEVPT